MVWVFSCDMPRPVSRVQARSHGHRFRSQAPAPSAIRPLRNAGGFEALGAVGIRMEPCDQALTEVSEPCRFGVEVGTTPTPAASNAPQGEHPIAAVPDLLDFPSEVL